MDRKMNYATMTRQSVLGEDFWTSRRGVAEPVRVDCTPWTKNLWPPLPPVQPVPVPLSSWPNTTKTKHRRTHYGHYGPARSNGPAGISYPSRDLRAFSVQRQSSVEDSGFSSSGSSASSVADDSDSLPSSISCKVSGQPQASSWKKVSRPPSYDSQFGTVASVLAAGVSDSEETDHCESDDEGHKGIFPNGRSMGRSLNHGKSVASTSEIKQFLQRMLAEKDNLRLLYSGRDLLDLGTNLATKFPLTSTELPGMNLPVFLQNRSQYHRLGKYGTTETFCFESCKKQCGFSFPIPPRDAKF